MKRTTRKSALVICNGEMPPKKLFSPLLEQKPFVICADGGANNARVLGITPHCIIGDLDSITQKTLKYFSSVRVIPIEEQYSTDLEKALNYLVANGYSSAIIVGAMGKRPDHTFSNFSILLKYHSRIAVKFIDEWCTVEVVQKKIRFNAKIGQHLSLAPMGTCSGIVTKGLRYPLKNETLALGVREGLSNQATGAVVSISVKKGSLLLFKIHPGNTA